MGEDASVDDSIGDVVVHEIYKIAKNLVAQCRDNYYL